MAAHGGRESAVSRWLRRGLVIPLYLALTALILASAPLWMPLCWLADRLQPGRSALGFVSFIAWYLICETVGMAACLATWIGSPPYTPRLEKRFVDWNSALQLRWTAALLGGAQRLFDFEIRESGRQALEGGPMLLLLRHVSMADTLLASTQVSAPTGIRLRYVLKRELLWDPCLDIVGNRLPNYFVDRRASGDDGAREIAGVTRLFDDLRPDEGVLIYPEGTRFTKARRAHTIAGLRQHGHEDLARRAESLEHVLLPRPGGTLALLAANPGLDAVICAHAGFEQTLSIWNLWNGGLRGVQVRLAFARVPFADLPESEDEGREWLFGWWEQIDHWLARVAALVEPADDERIAADAAAPAPTPALEAPSALHKA